MHDLSKSQLSYRKNCLLSFFPPPPPTFLNSFDFVALDFFCHPNPPPPPRFLIRSPFPLWTSEDMSQGWYHMLCMQCEHIVCMYVLALSHTQTQAHTYVHTYVHAHTHTYTHTHTHMHTHRDTPTHVHTHMQTHIHTRNRCV